jgi:hypothetical protein
LQPSQQINQIFRGRFAHGRVASKSNPVKQG